jgi:hypothetical protein
VFVLVIHNRGGRIVGVEGRDRDVEEPGGRSNGSRFKEEVRFNGQAVNVQACGSEDRADVVGSWSGSLAGAGSVATQPS